MRRTVFYSWQSDLPARENRNLIEKCLSRALKSIGRDSDAKIEPVLDRDTANIAGAPDIAHSILAKIAVSDVFVADVSIVNLGSGRPTPNPNVLVELGYAIAELGWENIILVQNTEFGGPESLPFDLRGRRTIVYAASHENNSPETRGLLQGRLEVGLRAALETGSTSNLPSGREANLWWGRWNFNVTSSTGGTLFIREAGPSGFLFDLNVYNGAHSGTVSAYARINSRNLAYCRLSNGEDQQEGELVFHRGMIQGTRTILVEEISPCSYHRGMRASFNGSFIREYEPWFDSGFMNEIELARLHKVVGTHLEKIRECTSDVGEYTVSEEYPTARAIFGGVPGLYTIMESIVMLNDDGEMWVAYIDDEIVRYFTNSRKYIDKPPKTIETWRQNFRDKVIEYCDPEMFLHENES